MGGELKLKLVCVGGCWVGCEVRKVLLLVQEFGVLARE